MTAVCARSSVSTEERTPTRHHAGKSTPLFSPAATKGAASIKMKAVTAGRVVLLFFQVWVTPRMTMLSPCFIVTTYPLSNATSISPQHRGDQHRAVGAVVQVLEEVVLREVGG
jgi:hypothetical protein